LIQINRIHAVVTGVVGALTFFSLETSSLNFASFAVIGFDAFTKVNLGALELSIDKNTSVGTTCTSGCIVFHALTGRAVFVAFRG